MVRGVKACKTVDFQGYMYDLQARLTQVLPNDKRELYMQATTALGSCMVVDGKPRSKAKAMTVTVNAEPHVERHALLAEALMQQPLHIRLHYQKLLEAIANGDSPTKRRLVMEMLEMTSERPEDAARNFGLVMG